MTDNSGLKVGLTYAAVGTGITFALKPAIRKASKMTVDFARNHMSPKEAYEATKGIFAGKNLMKTSSVLKRSFPAMLLSVACGAIVDWANRKQRANSEPNATTKKGNEYTKVNMGKKLGAALGVAAYGISSILHRAQFKKMLASSPNKAVSVGLVAASGALGGYLLGALTDRISNKQAAKEADKAA